MPIGDYIMTHAGIRFFPLDADPGMVTLEDIAHSLSNKCRFTGHTRSFYSVAEHSVIVSRHVPKELARQALLHDAAEAYLSDVARPLKRFLQFVYSKEALGQHKNAASDKFPTQTFEEIEEKLLEIIGQRFGIPAPIVTPEVHDTDTRLLAQEYLVLIKDVLPPGLQGVTPLPVELLCYGPTTAKDVFMQRAVELDLREMAV